MKSHFLATCCICLFCTTSAFAWNDKVTHRTLSFYAANAFFDPEFMESEVKGLKAKDLIEEGSEREDDWPWYWPPSARSGNHFHAPNRPLERAGWNETKGMSTPLWAQNKEEQEKFYGGDWSWGKVRDHLYNYLIATSKQAEDDNLVKMLKGLGYQMHLVQDMSQPNHVRDDTHIPDGFGWKWIVNGFETWAKDNNIKIIRNEILDKQDENGKPVFPVPDVQVDLTKLFDGDPSKVPVARLSDTREHLTELASADGKPTYAIKPSTSLSQGLAEYTNANFFSEKTAFAADRYALTDTRHQFPYPRKSETNLQEFIDSYLGPVVQTDVDGKSYLTFEISKEKTTGEPLKCLAMPGPNTLSFFKEFGGEGGMFYGSFQLDERCMKEYAEKLIPRTVGYSKAMLDYFFRGTIEITIPPDIPPNNRRIVLNAKNTAPDGEEMENGTIELMVAYTPYVKKDPALAAGKLVPSSEIKRLRIPEKTGLREISRSGTKLEFDLPEQLPPLARDISLVLVYRGDLGSEKYTDPSGTDYGKAVAFEEIYLDGINGDLDLSLPSRGVYAAVNDPALSASFSDFAVKARNTSATPSTGGNVELLAIYNKALDNPFDSREVPLEEEISYVSATVSGETIPITVGKDFLYPLASARIPVDAVNVYVYLLYHGSDGTGLHGLKDISEPTPVEVFNDTDQSCVNGQLYNSGEEAATAADLLGNHNGIFDEAILFPSNINNIYFKAGAPGTITTAPTASDNTLTGSGLLPGQKLRLGYIFTDYSFDYAIDEVVSPQGVYFPSQVLQGEGFEYQWDRGFDMMYGIRGQAMYNGAGAVYENKIYPPGSPACPSH